MVIFTKELSLISCLRIVFKGNIEEIYCSYTPLSQFLMKLLKFSVNIFEINCVSINIGKCDEITRESNKLSNRIVENEGSDNFDKLYKAYIHFKLNYTVNQILTINYYAKKFKNNYVIWYHKI